MTRRATDEQIGQAILGGRRIKLGIFLSALALIPLTSQAKDCIPQPGPQVWLETQAERWEPRLADLEGYEKPGQVRVCQASGGARAYYDNGRIYLQTLDETQTRLSLAHEYLHLAFRHHPRSRDERFIESTARHLVLQEASPWLEP